VEIGRQLIKLTVEGDMLKTLPKIKRIRGDVRAASLGLKALGKRLLERSVHRLIHKVFR
jgi:hypothetical protein